MSADSFQFRQFAVRHDRCAMKVGTDGVLLGAWCGVAGAARALDVGCGSGLIALMLAQRSASLRVVGIDVDGAAVAQAAANFAGSPWAGRLEAAAMDFRRAAPGGAFDLVVSNPPFFTETTLPGEAARAAARHARSLPLDSLVARAAGVLSAGGRLAVVVPWGRAAEVVAAAAGFGLFVRRRCDVRTVARKPPRRALLELGFGCGAGAREELTLLGADGLPSRRYAELTADFYL